MKLYIKRKAFTLVELIIVIAIMGIVFDIIYQTQNSNRNLFPKANAKSNIQQDVRLAASFISKDLRYARSVNILPDKPGTFSNNLVYIYSDGNNLVYRKNGVAKNIMLVESSRTVTLIFTHSTTGSFNDGKTVNFAIEGKTSEDFSLNSKVQILNLNKNVINGDNGYCISYSLTDFVNNPPVVTSSNPLDVYGADGAKVCSITHYAYDSIETMNNSITVDSTLPTPFSVEPFFIESDPGDFLTYSVASDNTDALAVSLDENNLIHFYSNSTVTGDTPVAIQINAVDNYGGFASTKFSILVKSTAVVNIDTLTFVNSGNQTYLKDSGIKEIDLTKYFSYNPSANITFTAAKVDGTDMTVTNNKLQVPTVTATGDLGYNVTLTATLTKADTTTIQKDGSINIVIKEPNIWFEIGSTKYETSGTTINNIKKQNPITLKVVTNVSGLIIKCSPLPNPVTSTSPFTSGSFDLTYNDSTKTYTAAPSNNGNGSITIYAYLYGYENDQQAYKSISITLSAN